MRIIVGVEHEGERLDRVAAALGGVTRSQLQGLADEGLVSLNSKPAKPSHKVHTGDVIEFHLPEAETEELVPEDISLRVLYRDEHLVIVDKPAGMVVYPAAGHPAGTLMNALRHLIGPLATTGAPLRPGVVHRLDKDTSGVIVVALTDQAYHSLVKQFHDRTITRRYLALILGSMQGQEGEMDAPIGRSTSDRKKMSTRTSRARNAMTHWKLLMRLTQASLIEARLATGRTHQIRVHFSAAGHPVLGDETYGGKPFLMIGGRKVVFRRQMLHAETLGITHPVSGEYIERTSAMPEDMAEAVKALTPVMRLYQEAE